MKPENTNVMEDLKKDSEPKKNENKDTHKGEPTGATAMKKVDQESNSNKDNWNSDLKQSDALKSSFNISAKKKQ